MILDINKISCGYGSRAVLKNISFSIASGEICCLLGPNGVGKTTLFKTILGFLKTIEGNISVDGEDIKALSRKQLARILGYVPQAHTPPFPYTVGEVVTMGRTVHLGIFSSPSNKDAKIAEGALEVLGIQHLRDRIYTEISGGERQLVLIARALAKEPEFLIMDEPTANLDFGNQIRVVEQVNKLARRGLGILMTTHSPEHVFQCDSNVALLDREGGLAFGKAEKVVTEESLLRAYGIQVKIAEVPTETGSKKVCVPDSV
ncbi:putative ABC transporter ATP-binding protein [Ruminiclostridium hungatei]|uniref:Putative ABC transporter ATP-binding protein n=1 Tax=Ruminiclostridium hungatei TaxID=48256 RepID=A0A1V4SH63_RUMHU|nr:ABC transporter ATP-binding protein [Ruminiclostridium hungatei]OPX42805.1 putative ABC transporter ATP-binding protein [Ruminiclostridium hungatei]